MGRRGSDKEVVPYIDQGRRPQYSIYDLQPPENGADLNYVLCRLLSRFTSYRGLSYRTIEEVTTAMTGALNEFNRLVAWPYEDKKRQMNGDVWDEIIR